MAWLKVAPDDNKKGSVKQKKTRLQAWVDRGLDVDMPPVNNLPFMIEWFDEVGPGSQGMSGLVPLTFTEVKSWAEGTNTELTDWEFRTIVRMSRQFCYQYDISSDPNCEAPYEMQVDDDSMARMRAKADEQIRSMF